MNGQRGIAPFLLLLLAGLVLPAGRFAAASEAPDASAIKATAESFHRALADGKAEQVRALLLPDALIVEAGAVETRAQYESEHLGQDIAYARALPGRRLSEIVRQEGNIAWVTSTFRLQGNFEGKPVDRLAAETMLLTRTASGWRIRLLHWSSGKGSGG